MATEYGGAYGDQPWRDAEPQQPGQPARDDGPPSQQPEPSRWQRHRTPTSTVIAGLALALGLIGLIISGFGVATQVMPRRFTAQQQTQITNWEFGRAWRTLSAGAIFRPSVSYPPPAVLDNGSPLTLAARRIGIARPTSCRSAADDAAVAVLARNGCQTLLRATYADGTSSYVVTVGVAVLPSTAQATAAAAQLNDAAEVNGIEPGVHAVAFADTAAAWFTNQRRQLSGATSAGTYVALYTVGYADSRPREPVAGDNYAAGEMTSLGKGVAQAVLGKVGASVPAPHCPGTPGC